MLHRVCMYALTGTCMHANLEVQRTAHACLHTYIIHTYIHNTYIHTYMHTYIHTYIHTYVRTYVRTYIRTYIHTYITKFIKMKHVELCAPKLSTLCQIQNLCTLCQIFKARAYGLNHRVYEIFLHKQQANLF